MPFLLFLSQIVLLPSLDLCFPSSFLFRSQFFGPTFLCVIIWSVREDRTFNPKPWSPESFLRLRLVTLPLSQVYFYVKKTFSIFKKLKYKKKNSSNIYSEICA